jgi:hypothetical protein
LIPSVATIYGEVGNRSRSIRDSRFSHVLTDLTGYVSAFRGGACCCCLTALGLSQWTSGKSLSHTVLNNCLCTGGTQTLNTALTASVNDASHLPDQVRFSRVAVDCPLGHRLSTLTDASSETATAHGGRLSLCLRIVLSTVCRIVVAITHVRRGVRTVHVTVGFHHVTETGTGIFQSRIRRRICHRQRYHHHNDRGGHYSNQVAGHIGHSHYQSHPQVFMSGSGFRQFTWMLPG